MAPTVLLICYGGGGLAGIVGVLFILYTIYYEIKASIGVRDGVHEYLINVTSPVFLVLLSSSCGHSEWIGCRVLWDTSPFLNLVVLKV